MLLAFRNIFFFANPQSFSSKYEGKTEVHSSQVEFCIALDQENWLKPWLSIS